MRIYTVHIPAPRPGDEPCVTDPAEDAVAVKEGFCWPAMLFSVFWALWHRMWGVALGLTALLAAVGDFGVLAGIDNVTGAALSAGVYILIGGFANDVRRWSLGRRGYTERGIILAGGAEAAVLRYIAGRDPAAAGGV